ncbi:hypothetical protein BHM03_00043901 [Ensete ventricosum]|uniref:Uncharacterized protein n=1 Tax=Ensete ventricosum TaxID=4639 RepID=A0A445MKL1_ENSVE|nr:hypothetical protein BHM03_00043901 [Ensete ventricosum]
MEVIPLPVVPLFRVDSLYTAEAFIAATQLSPFHRCNPRGKAVSASASAARSAASSPTGDPKQPAASKNGVQRRVASNPRAAIHELFVLSLLRQLINRWPAAGTLHRLRIAIAGVRS